jgi:integral membrane protein (TIGR01906 family)
MRVGKEQGEYKDKNRWRHWLLAVVLTWVFICLAVTVVLRSSWLYEKDISEMGLPQELGMSREFILEQYQALIDYNVPGGPDALVFPGLPSSENGLQHFAEVKVIFMVFQVGLWIGLAVSVWGIMMLRKGKPLYLKYAGILSLVIPAAIGLGAVLFWQQFFVLFHQVLFQNDYWLFDGNTDPIIYLLPDRFFLHCAIAIVGMTICCGILSLGCYLWISKRRRKHKS